MASGQNAGSGTTPTLIEIDLSSINMIRQTWTSHFTVSLGLMPGPAFCPSDAKKPQDKTLPKEDYR